VHNFIEVLWAAVQPEEDNPDWIKVRIGWKEDLHDGLGEVEIVWIQYLLTKKWVRAGEVAPTPPSGRRMLWEEFFLGMKHLRCMSICCFSDRWY
jgi:hypothetical protein